LAPGGFVTTPQHPGITMGPQPPTPQAIRPEQPSDAGPSMSPMSTQVNGMHAPEPHELH
jgi:hypothetical protein